LEGNNPQTQREVAKGLSPASAYMMPPCGGLALHPYDVLCRRSLISLVATNCRMLGTSASPVWEASLSSRSPSVMAEISTPRSGAVPVKPDIPKICKSLRHILWSCGGDALSSHSQGLRQRLVVNYRIGNYRPTPVIRVITRQLPGKLPCKIITAQTP
jgi:hypothetical protein